MSWFFADDRKLVFSLLKTENDSAKLYAWSIVNGMLINAKKLKCLIFKVEVIVFIGQETRFSGECLFT